MAWLSQNWIWILAGLAFVALHLFGHGGHRGHGEGQRDEGGPHGHGLDDRALPTDRPASSDPRR
ncbi:DUF2933 domain-containing protein [Phenylobacterium haematophilum]|uniref:DUF2933 domain-containing protein n=1 Tax=Phenylobacterium haematophilum TaxID=98513 RepID=UPI00161873DF